MNRDSVSSYHYAEIERIVGLCLDELFEKDLILLQNDVSERAITHKLAEYLQRYLPGFHVDCEYNRNSLVPGDRTQKWLIFEAETRRKELRNKEQREAVSAYPDIIAHHRRTNSGNLLVVEVKKSNNRESLDYDFRKLEAFTDSSELNTYHFRFGVSITLDIGLHPDRPKYVWFVGGKRLKT